jgi:hypothetical protein
VVVCVPPVCTSDLGTERVRTLRAKCGAARPPHAMFAMLHMTQRLVRPRRTLGGTHLGGWRSEESAFIKCYRAVYNRSTTGLNTDARKNVASAALAATHNAPQATELAPNSRGGTRGGWHITHRQTCNTAQ